MMDVMSRTPLRCVLVCAALMGIAACGRTTTSAGPASSPVAESSPAIQLGTKFKIFSNVLSEERSYWVHLPETHKAGKASSASYPVLYVLDGDFLSAVSMVDFLSGLVMIPEMIVVAVLNTDRMRDMTPTHVATGPNGEAEPGFANTGGGNAFERFLETELIPKIDSTYPTMPYRVVAGHSLSGLLSIHAVLKTPVPFQAVIAVAPSVWWDKEVVVKQAATFLTKPDPRLKSIYTSTGALPLDNGEDDSAGRAAARSFTALLGRIASPTLRTKAQEFEHDNHQSVAFPGLYDGLLFTFEGYKLPTSAALADPSRIEAHYRELSARFGVEWQVPQRLIDLVSYSLLFERKQVDEAIRLLDRNVKAYPNSSAAHEHLGRAYLLKGDKTAALKYFERALALDPSDDDTRAEIVKLRSE
jgi:predicted alpha/beta superfamily hydrolase